MARTLVLAAAVFAFLSAAKAAELDGVVMPNERSVLGTPLLLNGIGVRSYSIFNIHIYVAGLYLENRSDNPRKIMQSKGFKLLVLHFLHDVTAEEARTSWQKGFAQNCRAPCYLDPAEVAEFLARVPAARKGDIVFLLFSPKGLSISDDGRLLGNVDDVQFADLILDTFLGAAPPTLELKRQLLGLAD